MAANASDGKPVRVYFTKERFPIRHYGTAIFPAGEYQALRVDIGKAAGHNWWCAFYPNLCYTPEKNFTLSESGKKQWKKITELTQGKWLKKTKHYFTKLKKFLPYWAKRSV